MIQTKCSFLREVFIFSTFGSSFTSLHDNLPLCFALSINKTSKKKWKFWDWENPHSKQGFYIINPINSDRGSHRECSLKIDVLKNFVKFTGKHLCQSLYVNKVAGLRPLWTGSRTLSWLSCKSFAQHSWNLAALSKNIPSSFIYIYSLLCFSK